MATEKPSVKACSFSFLNWVVWVVSSSLQWDSNFVPTAFYLPTYTVIHCCIREALFPVWREVSLTKWPQGKDSLNQLVRTSPLSVWYTEWKQSAIKLSIGVQSTYMKLAQVQMDKRKLVHLDLWWGDFHVFLLKIQYPSSPIISIYNPSSILSHCLIGALWSLFSLLPSSCCPSCYLGNL